eukprot:scaffold268072_cov26-Tisochrysis_lutea.AAC.2
MQHLHIVRNLIQVDLGGSLHGTHSWHNSSGRRVSGRALASLPYAHIACRRPCTLNALNDLVKLMPHLCKYAPPSRANTRAMEASVLALQHGPHAQKQTSSSRRYVRML